MTRKRSVKSKSNPGMVLRQPCDYFLNGTCTKSQRKRKRRQKCCSYCETCTTLGLCLARLRIIEISKRRRVSGETRCQKSCDRFEKYGSLSLRYVKQVSGKKRTIAWKKVKNLHQRSPYAMKFEDRSQEETERQQRCVRGKAWNLAKNMWKLKEKDQVAFYSPAKEWILLTASIKEPKEREFVVDSGASMHMVSKRGLNSAELETMRMPRNPTTMMTANDEVQTREEATVCVKEWDLFVTVMLLEETPAVLSLGKLCEDHGYIYHWTSGQKPHLTQNGKNIKCNISNYVPFVVPGLSTSSSTSSSPASSTSSAQDSVVPGRSGSTSEELRGNPIHNPTETENKNKNEGREEVQSDLLRDLPD